MAGYGDDTAFETWLTDNGYTLPAGAPTSAVLRQRGSAALDATYGARFKGTPTAGYAQERAWPRMGAVVQGETIPDSVVPLAVETASYMLALHSALNGSTTSDGFTGASPGAGVVKKEKVDVVEVEYHAPNALAPGAEAPYSPFTPGPNIVTVSIVDEMMKPYLILPTYNFGAFDVGPGTHLG